MNYKFPWEQVRHRTKYYKALITAALKAVGVPMSYVSMVEMSSYQVTQQYMVDFWKLCALCSQQDARDTGAEVGASTMLSPLLTPLLQELGEESLGVDAEFGGTDQVSDSLGLCVRLELTCVFYQRGIFNLGEQFLPDLGYEKRAHLLNELLPSLTGGKMSSSHPAHTTIMFLDDADAVVEKLAGAACPPGTVGRREWVFVPPPPEGCALVHGASSLARLSLGRLRSPLHRVTQPADGAGKRYFLSYFLRPEHRVRETWAAKDSIGTVA